MAASINVTNRKPVYHKILSEHYQNSVPLIMVASIPEAQVDLDKFLAEFNSWQLKVSEVTKESRSLKDEIDGLRKLLDTSQERQKTILKDNQELRTIVDELQKSLNKRCDFEEENVQLQKQIEVLKEEMANFQESVDAAKLKHQNEREELSYQHTEELKNLEAKFNEEGSHKSFKFQQEIESRSRQITELKQRLVELEKEKESEIVKLRLEYDSKLLKLQKKTNANQQMSTPQSGQDIFRKKLQHAKEEHEKEVTGLKKTVNELMQQLQAKTQVVSGPAYTSGTTTSKKRRTYLIN